MTSKESFDRDAVEVHGIRFETLVPERILTIPNEKNIKNSVQWGIRVTNSTLIPYRFIFFYLLPELQKGDGKIIPIGYARNATKAPSESDFILAKPE